jgi:hypothetical protein
MQRVSIEGLMPKWAPDLGLPARRQMLCATFCTFNHDSRLPVFVRS